MKERVELELILKLIGKYNLPLSPILEYAIKEKMEEYPEEEQITTFVNDERSGDVDITDDNYNTSFLPKSNDIKWFCLSALTCLEGQMDNRTYQILNDTLNGESRSKIAFKHNLTQERIRQIVVKATKQAKELLIEQRNNLEKEKGDNARLNVQLNLMREDIDRLKALIPKELLLQHNGVDLDTELVELLETPIEDINLPIRAVNILLSMEFEKFVDIPQIQSEKILRKIRNSGQKTVHNISCILKDFHLTFGMSYTGIVNALKANDWHAAKRKWIRERKKTEEIKEHNNNIKQEKTVAPDWIDEKVRHTDIIKDETIKDDELIEEDELFDEVNAPLLFDELDEEDEIIEEDEIDEDDELIEEDELFDEVNAPLLFDELDEEDDLIEEVNDPLFIDESNSSQIEDESSGEKEQMNTVKLPIEYQHYNFGHHGNHCFINDRDGKRVFSSSGRILLIGNKFYRISYTYSSISINLVVEEDRNMFVLGKRIVNAQYRSPLYICLDENKYLEQIKEVKKDSNSNEYYIKVKNLWYDSTGYPANINEYVIVENKRKEDLINETKQKDDEKKEIFNLKIVDYNEKSIVVIGDTKPHKETLKAMGGYFSTKFLCGTGWLFNKNKRNEVEKYINKVNNSNLTKEQKNDTISEEDDSKDSDFSEFSVKIGDTLRLFPSQIVGKVTKLRVDNTGHRKIVVKSDDGRIVEIYDNKYLYEKVFYQEKERTKAKAKVSRYEEKVLLTSHKNTKVKVGDCIQWKPTGDVGRIIGFKQIGAIQKIILRLKGGSEIEVYDNPKAYDVIMRR